MPRCDWPCQPRTTAMPPPSVIAGKIGSPITAASTMPSTPSGNSARTPATASSPRGTKASAPIFFSSASSLGEAMAITRRPSATPISTA